MGQFNSFGKGGIVIASIPLMPIGGTLGLVVSTLITLDFVPAVRTLLFRVPTADAGAVVARARR